MLGCIELRGGGCGEAVRYTYEDTWLDLRDALSVHVCLFAMDV